MLHPPPPCVVGIPHSWVRYPHRELGIHIVGLCVGGESWLGEGGDRGGKYVL